MQTIINDAYLIATTIPHCLSADGWKAVKQKHPNALTLKCIHILC